MPSTFSVRPALSRASSRARRLVCWEAYSVARARVVPTEGARSWQPEIRPYCPASFSGSCSTILPPALMSQALPSCTRAKGRPLSRTSMSRVSGSFRFTRMSSI